VPLEVGLSLEKNTGFPKSCQATVGFAAQIPLEKAQAKVGLRREAAEVT
jgi:hypothetical protein